MSNRKTLNIFISSPTDVNRERRRSALVINRLNREFSRFFELKPMLWEYEPMMSAGHFQDVIEPAPSDSDIVIVILWSRLGSPLPEKTNKREYRGLDGRAPVTGTEWEFEDALKANQSQGSPDLLVYRSEARPLPGGEDAEGMRSALGQIESLEGFWKQHFYDTTTGFKLAYNTFSELDQFEQILEEHLRDLIKKRLPKAATDQASDESALTWHKGSPFLGLRAFDFEHAPVFFGRYTAQKEVVEALSTRAELGTAFILVMGASGSGKSSLVRAGILPDLVTPGVVSGVELWRRAVITPSGGGIEGRDVFDHLATTLIEGKDALPELTSTGFDAPRLAERFRKGDGRDIIEIALRRVANQEDIFQIPECLPPVRLILVVDQMEELFSDHVGLSDQTRKDFENLIESLAKSGLVWVIATMRSDFFHRLADVPQLRDLCAGNGQYLLLPPNPNELEQMIRLPAQAAGLRFDENPDTLVTLDGVLREAASGHDALPLLEFTLDELYRRDIELGGGSALTYESYEALGGLEGAIAERANEACATIGSDKNDAIDAALRALVTLGDGDHVTARIVAEAEIKSAPDRNAVVDQLIQARLLVVGESDAGISVRLAHESLLRRWPRYVDLIERDRDFLKARGRVNAAMTLWQEQNEDLSRLLANGMALVEGEHLLSNHQDELNGDLIRYIEMSIHTVRKKQESRTRRLRIIAAGMTGLAVLSGLFAWQSHLSSLEAGRQRQLADDNFIVAQAAKNAAKDEAARAQRAEKKAEKGRRAALLQSAIAMAATAPAQSAMITLDLLKQTLDLGEAPSPDLKDFLVTLTQPDELPTEAPSQPGDRSVLSASGGLIALVRHGGNSLTIYDSKGDILDSIQTQNTTIIDLISTLDGKGFYGLGENGLTFEISYDEDGNTEFVDQEQPEQFSLYGSASALSLNPITGTLLIGYESGHVVERNGDTNTDVFQLSSTVTALNISADGRYIVSGDDHGRASLISLATHDPHEVFSISGAVQEITISPDARMASVLSANNQIDIIDLRLGSKIFGYSLSSKTVSVTFQPDNRGIIFRHVDGSFKTLDFGSRTWSESQQTGINGSIALSPLSPLSALNFGLNAEQEFKVSAIDWKGAVNQICLDIYPEPAMQAPLEDFHFGALDVCESLVYSIGDSALLKGHQALYSDTNQSSYFWTRESELDRRDGMGRSALHLAAALGHPVLKTLVDISPASALQAEDYRGETPLMVAARIGDLEAVKLLVSAGSPVDTLSQFHETPLMAAAEFGQANVVQYLLEQGVANINQTSISGENALGLALKGHHQDVSEALRGKGAQDNVQEMTFKDGAESYVIPESALAETRAGIAYELGTSKTQSYEDAAQMYQQGADKGDAFAMYLLARAHRFGRGMEVNFDTAFQLAKASAEAGSSHGINEVAGAYENGRGVESNQELALSHYMKAAEMGNRRAQGNLGLQYQWGALGLERDFVKARLWLSKAADQGLTYFTARLAALHFNGLGGPVNQSEAIRLFKLAGEEDFALYWLGHIYEQGNQEAGVKPDPQAAQDYYQRAAQYGHSNAGLRLAAFFQRGLNGEASPEQARKWYVNSLKKGANAAALNLAFLLSDETNETRQPSHEQRHWMQVSTGIRASRVNNLWARGIEEDLSLAQDRLATYISPNMTGRKRVRYDDRGRIVRTDTQTSITKVTYDDVHGKISSTTKFNRDGNEKPDFTTYNYDDNGNLIRAARNDEDWVELSYNTNSLITTMTSNNGKTLVFEYDLNLRKPIKISIEGSGSIQVEYDASGEILNVESEEGHTMALEVTQQFKYLLSLVEHAGVDLGL